MVSPTAWRAVGRPAISARGVAAWRQWLGYASTAAARSRPLPIYGWRASSSTLQQAQARSPAALATSRDGRPTGEGGGGGSGHSSTSGNSSVVPESPLPASPTPVAESDGAVSAVMTALTPRKIVSELDRFIVGQADAKRAMAIALRNRWRRHQLPDDVADEVIPKNILLCGPTGVGKSEIARRLAKLVDAPFIKAEASKYTEVGFHGRDVDQIIRDLVENSIQLVKQRQRRRMKAELERLVEDRILDELTGASTREATRESFRQLLRKGALEEREIDVEEPRAGSGRPNVLQLGDAGPERMTEVIRSLDKMFMVHRSGAGSGSKRRMKIRDARPVIEENEAERLLSDESVVRSAIQLAEQDGIVFIDEIDKICTPTHYRHGADASAEGVQRDLLPLIEGSTVATKYGNVDTDHILFVAAGAFHHCKPSDLMAELQGRLPIRVELRPLTESDLYRILTEPENSLLKQQMALLRTEGIELEFTDAAAHEMAAVAAEVNTTVENIGARRLHTVVERIIESISFDAPDLRGQRVVIDTVNVRDSLGDMLLKSDLSRFVL
ncbi:hypothetical protein CDCA_CDCA01G0027 [Cyanidium caldarium]|uniref:Uncharacterized protein n=1 Tax=Cyanidium caldarium TaxID=2771 RepID=A0AAV9IP24_CYACA|nr:hypothetical protein CDCA_CDCA01G0027 [Cyanidium caldarium]